MSANFERIGISDSQFFVFFLNDTATTEIYTLSLHDALPILWAGIGDGGVRAHDGRATQGNARRSEEHTSELQSRQYLVCRLLLEKKHNNEEKRIVQTGRGDGDRHHRTQRES